MKPPFSRTLADLLFEQAERCAGAPAVIGGDCVISYADLAHRAGRVAAGLRDCGVRRGDRVGLLVNNRSEWLESFFGATTLGAVVVALSTWSKRDELAFLLADSDVQVLIALDRFGEQHFASDLHALIPEARAGVSWNCAACPRLREMFILGDDGDGPFKSYADLIAAKPLGLLAPGEGPSAADDAIIIYTSGSSSRPKAVPLTQYGIVENGFNIGERQGYEPGE